MWKGGAELHATMVTDYHIRTLVTYLRLLKLLLQKKNPEELV